MTFWKWASLKGLLKKHGPVLLFIFITVEIIEHLGGFLLISWLGAHVHNNFFALLPAPLLFCWHWLTTPIIFFIYLKLVKNKKNGD